ncbi:hypothetical protein AALO_G00106340 [Alosa alosa]|uniref:CCHC-type domain-containing protein n=1 Tax=Alosa alosa TaxID=278164 RepID=A0AAV6GZ09_9TELE|nr:hypothetical protein AALO_G00106340 [Alosa alosa]
MGHCELCGLLGTPQGSPLWSLKIPGMLKMLPVALMARVICGSRLRVELSTGTPRRSHYDRPPTRRPFDPNDRCYECGEKGHYAYDCHRYSRRHQSRSGSRSYSRSRGRRYSCSHSRSGSRGRRSRSGSRSRSRSHPRSRYIFSSPDSEG